MRIKVTVALALLCGSALFAQKQDSSSSSSSSSSTRHEVKSETYVRRFSVGATLSVLGLTLVPAKTANPVTTTPPVDAMYTTADASQRIGYGGVAQLLITNRFAVNGSFLIRRIGYKMNSDILTGVFDPTALIDERTHTVTNEDTRARLYDIPVVLRFYGKDRYQSGPRWFAEAGGAFRRVSHIRTSIDTTVDAGPTSCCNFTPATPAHESVRGLVAGFGVQLIDPVGIRVVPEFRYTRWLNETFNDLTTTTRRDEIAAMISLTF
jgi:hypothetical protein